MTIGSLFAGIGGLELGLEAAGLGPVRWQVEIDPFARSILARHWPDATRFDDVRAVGADNLAPVDIICGGFPCQDISTAGRGAGIDGARSGLWREYARIVGELRPRIVVVENVAALVGRGLDRVLGDLSERGYDAVWFPLRAADVGAPHRRERLFIIAWRVEHSDGRGCDTGGIAGVGSAMGQRRDDTRDAAEATHAGAMADAERPRRHKRAGARGERGGGAEPAHGNQRRRSDLAAGAEALSGMGGIPDGLPAGPHLPARWPARPGEAQHEWEPPRTVKTEPHRARRLKALGNAVVPQVAYVVGCVVRKVLAATSPLAAP